MAGSLSRAYKANKGKSMTYKGKSMAPGGGGRFAALKDKLAGQKGVTNPGALAAAIGRKKYGKKRFQNMSRKGR